MKEKIIGGIGIFVGSIVVGGLANVVGKFTSPRKPEVDVVKALVAAHDKKATLVGPVQAATANKAVVVTPVNQKPSNPIYHNNKQGKKNRR